MPFPLDARRVKLIVAGIRPCAIDRLGRTGFHSREAMRKYGVDAVVETVERRNVPFGSGPAS